MMKFANSTKLRRDLPELLKRDYFESIIITKSGQPVAVLMSISEYRSLQSLVTLTAEPERFKKIIEEHEAFQRGEREGLIELDDIDWDAPGGPALKSAKPSEPKDGDK